MGLSKETKLYIQLTLSCLLFVTELGVGYYVKSIALIADAFHMLNDVLSLIIAVYAVKLAKSTEYNPKYTYGLQRAEVLGALINAVLLLGLCLTIVAEAIPRFFEPVEIQNPELILIVGSIGLVFNVAGMFLFGHHGHSHDHDHDHSHGHSHNHDEDVKAVQPDVRRLLIEESLKSPAHFQQAIIDTARVVAENQELEANEHTHLLSGSANKGHDHSHDHGHSHKHDHGSSHGHSHSSGSEGHLNMQGVYLHVLGDALASIAVIATALVIWKGTFPQRFLFDPIISIVITLLIIKFTMPLIKSASFILLQGVPSGVPVDEVRELVCKVDGVDSVHDLHIWQLSDTKSVGSVHVVVGPGYHDKFMSIAAQVKHILHVYGVHSVTIQPEFSNFNSNPTSPLLQSNSNNLIDIVEISNNQCLLPCQAECAPAQCCPP